MEVERDRMRYLLRRTINGRLCRYLELNGLVGEKCPHKRFKPWYIADPGQPKRTNACTNGAPPTETHHGPWSRWRKGLPCLPGPLRLTVPGSGWFGGGVLYLMPGAGGTVPQNGRYCIRKCWTVCVLDGCIVARTAFFSRSTLVFLVAAAHGHQPLKVRVHSDTDDIVQGYGDGNETAIVDDSDADGVKALAPCHMRCGSGGGGWWWVVMMVMVVQLQCPNLAVSLSSGWP